MQKPITIVFQLLAAGMMLLGNTLAQNTPAATAQPTQSAPAKKPTTSATKKAPVTSKTATPLTLKTQKEKLSYAIGMNIGQSMKKDSLEVDPNIGAAHHGEIGHAGSAFEKSGQPDGE